jgi:MoxR-like ATPase
MTPIIEKLISSLSDVIFSKDDQIKLALCSLISKGHLLIEDLPGMGKTTLSHGLADALSLKYQRVQFTNDLLPSDITGSSVFNSKEQCFEFHSGPIFSEVMLADEINRASPKTQSALLEAMEEKQVTVDGKTMNLPEPFFVIATQNPNHQSGTHPLPESQLDRFFMRISLGYPSDNAEKKLISGVKDTQQSFASSVITKDELIHMQHKVTLIKISESIVNYILNLINYTRVNNRYSDPLSPRASIAIGLASKTWAFMHGRDYVTHDDVQAIFAAVAAHRLNINYKNQDKEIAKVIENVPVIL